MIVAIHQPNYLPWLGYLHKLLSCDVFVVLDHVQFTHGYTQRVKILTQGKEAWLTVPVKVKGLGAQPILATQPDESHRWRPRHLKTLRLSYARAPFFDEVFPLVQEVLSGTQETIAELNTQLLRGVARGLGACCPFVFSRDLDLQDVARNEMLARAVRLVGGTEYLHGKGGGEYQDPEVFRAAGVSLRAQNFVHPVYRQRGTAEFLPGLSGLDCLMNLGWEGTRKLLLSAPAGAGSSGSGDPTFASNSANSPACADATQVMSAVEAA